MDFDHPQFLIFLYLIQHLVHQALKPDHYMTSLLKCLFLVIFYMASRLTYYVYLSSIYSHYINLSRLNRFYISQKRPNNILGLYNIASNYASLILAAPEL